MPLVRYGLVTGSEGAGMLWLPRAGDRATDERSAPVAIAVAVTALRDMGARFVLAELPGDPVHGALTRALRARGFVEAGMIPDLVDDGIALHILRLDLDS